MTVPMAMGMIALMSFNLIDTFFIGLLGTNELAAISFTFPVTFTVISLIIGLGIGTSAVIARSLGSGDESLARDQATTALFVSLILVSLLSSLGLIFIEPIFKLLGSNDIILKHINDYMSLWYFSSVFLVLPMVGNSVLRASGDTKTPSLIMGAGGAINAILDPMFIFGFGPIPAMGIQGAAIATLLAWICGSIIIVYTLSIRRGLMHLYLPVFARFKSAAKKILTIALPAAGANMLTPLAMAILTAIVANYGKEAVAAFGVGQRLESIASLVVLSLSMTLPPFISQNQGAGFYQRVRDAYKICCRFVLAWQFFIYLCLAALAPLIAMAFASEPEVTYLIKMFLWIVPLGYGVQGIVILTNSSFNALHLPNRALLLSFIRLFVCYVPCAYIGGELFGIIGLFAGCVLGNFIMSLLSYSVFQRVKES
ncbi:MATE family efflux transporter [Gayadomonas joobiniege]|uniref:MATE family efflux transporter n=1 Tax=Gayadomonas joobiniege TaxID=1234606 RepID=UPI001ED9AF84|nr:MATE family efflux transporter [Gayadomonas joobiniege]